MAKHILVTGASSGIGLALVKLLVRDHGCHVYLGSRSIEKGEACLKGILDELPAAAGQIDVVQIDVTDSASINACAEGLKAKGIPLAALVNNAGVGLAQPGAPSGPEGILDTNFYGVKRVTEAVVPLIDPSEGRIVNVSSGAASAFVKGQDAPTKALFSNVELTFDELGCSEGCGCSRQSGLGQRLWAVQGCLHRAHSGASHAVPDAQSGEPVSRLHRHTHDQGLQCKAHTRTGLCINN